MLLYAQLKKLMACWIDWLWMGDWVSGVLLKTHIGPGNVELFVESLVGCGLAITISTPTMFCLDILHYRGARLYLGG